IDMKDLSAYIGVKPRSSVAKALNAAHRNSSAERTKLNIRTSKDALTTARMVAREVPSMVASAWKPTWAATRAAAPPKAADWRQATRQSSPKSVTSRMVGREEPLSTPSTSTDWTQDG